MWPLSLLFCSTYVHCTILDFDEWNYKPEKKFSFIHCIGHGVSAQKYVTNIVSKQLVEGSFVLLSLPVNFFLSSALWFSDLILSDYFLLTLIFFIFSLF